MKEKNYNKIFTCFFVIMLSMVLIPISSLASAPCTISGYVYIDDVIIDAEEIVLSFLTQDITANLYTDGYYVVDFNENAGELGTFYITYESVVFTAVETITIEQGVIIYELDLHAYTEPNNPPDKPINPVPANNSENIDLNPHLSVLVSDSDDDLLNVYFYNASDDAILGTSLGVESNTRAEIQITDLAYETNYSWYVVVNDSENETKSDIFTFKTTSEDKIPPYITIKRPEQGALYIFDYKLFSGILSKTIIIGKIKIELDVIDNESSVELVEIYINKTTEKKLTAFTSEPYSYLWRTFVFGEHKLIVRAYDAQDNIAEKTIVLKKFF